MKCLGDVAMCVGGHVKDFLARGQNMSIKEQRNGKISQKEVRCFV